MYYAHATMSHSWKDWEIAATETMHNVQIGSAGIIYRFLNEVSGTINTTENSKINEIMVVIKTANEDKAGTDHYIHFGIEAKMERNMNGLLTIQVMILKKIKKIVIELI